MPFLLAASIFVFIIASAATLAIVHDLYVWAYDNILRRGSGWAMAGSILLAMIWMFDAALLISAILDPTSDAYTFMAVINSLMIGLYALPVIQELAKVKTKQIQRKRQKQQLELEETLKQLDPFTAEWAKFEQELQESSDPNTLEGAKNQLHTFTVSQFISSPRNSYAANLTALVNELGATVNAAASMAIVFRNMELLPNHRSASLKPAIDAFGNLTSSLMLQLSGWRVTLSGMSPEMAQRLQKDISTMQQRSAHVRETLTDMEEKVRRLTPVLGVDQFTAEAEQRLASVTRGLTEAYDYFAPSMDEPTTATVEQEAALPANNVRQLPPAGSFALHKAMNG